MLFDKIYKSNKVTCRYIAGVEQRGRTTPVQVTCGISTSTGIAGDPFSPASVLPYPQQ